MSMGARILLVDDDARIRALVRRILLADDHVIIEASNGARAFELLQNDRFDLIITDLLMPDTDGIELLQLVQSLGESAPAVIAISGGMGAWSPLTSAEMLGASETLAKPFTAAQLRDAVGRQLTGADAV